MGHFVRTMDRKLTLKLDGTIIDRAKEYAELNQVSVSGLVERYLKTLTEPRAPRPVAKGSVVAEVSGVIALPEGYDERDDYRQAVLRRNHG